MNDDSSNKPVVVEAVPAELVVLPLTMLSHVAGGLPYNGLNVSIPVCESLSGEPTTDLPYNGL